MTLEISPEERERIIDAIIDRTWQHQLATIEELTLISVPRFAGMVDLSTPQARRVLEETIDFGPQNTRVSLAEARRCIEARRVKKLR
jgi:hypothetical protein